MMTEKKLDGKPPSLTVPIMSTNLSDDEMRFLKKVIFLMFYSGTINAL